MPDERLLSLTFALEDAVVRRNWQDVNAIFDERGKLLDAGPRLDPSKFDAILEADRRLQARLESERDAIAAKLRRTKKVSAARKLYLKR